MAINPETAFVGKITPSSPEYTYGEARDVTNPGDQTGTPFNALFVNDIFGFQQALLDRGGVVPSGNPDKANDSQYLEALLAGDDKRYSPKFATVAAMVAGNPVSLDGLVVDLVIGMVIAIDDYATGNNSGIMFGRVVAGGTGTADGGSYIDLANGNQFEQNFPAVISVKMFGAVGDITTDDTISVRSAYDFGKNNAKSLYINGGTFRVTETLNFDGLGMNTFGAGSQSTIRSTLLIDHTNGAGVLVSQGRQTLSYFRIKGSSTREVAPEAIAGAGLVVEPDDTPGNLISQVGLDWMLVDDHYGSGIVINQCTGVTMTQTVVRDCRRHGFVFGNSDESTRTNKDNWTGMLFANECRFSSDGHSVVIGAPEGVAQGAAVFRAHMRSIDSESGPVNSAGLTLVDSCGWWVRGQNVKIELSALNPGDTSGEALIISGSGGKVTTNRLLGLDTSTHGIRVVSWITNRTRDLKISQPLIVGTKPSTAVVILDQSTTSPRAAVVENEVSVFSSQVLNGTIMSTADKLLVAEYSDGQKSRINTDHFVNTLATPSNGNSFIGVVGGVLDVDRSFVRVTGEGSVADSIDRITFNGGAAPDGMILRLVIGSNSQPITINNNSGGLGTVRCGSNRPLNDKVDIIKFVYDSLVDEWKLEGYQVN